MSLSVPSHSHLSLACMLFLYADNTQFFFSFLQRNWLCHHTFLSYIFTIIFPATNSLQYCTASAMPINRTTNMRGQTSSNGPKSNSMLPLISQSTRHTTAPVIALPVAARINFKAPDICLAFSREPPHPSLQVKLQTQSPGAHLFSEDFSYFSSIPAFTQYTRKNTTYHQVGIDISCLSPSPLHGNTQLPHAQ